MVQTRHDGYSYKCSIEHHRRITWHDIEHIEVHDRFICRTGLAIREGFHLDPACIGVKSVNNKFIADLKKFHFIISFPHQFDVKVYYGSREPFMGWRTTIYGQWEPIYSVVFNSKIADDNKYQIDFLIKKIYEVIF